MVQRNAGKAKRKRRILDSARRLIVEGGVDALAMRQLAEGAQVSVRTLYNLFGNKDDILDALVAELLHELDRTIEGLVLGDPVERCKAIVRVSIDRLIQDQVVYRPVLRAQSRRLRSYGEADRQSLATIRIALEEAAQRRMIAAQFSPTNLADQLYSGLQHVILLWAHGVLDDSQARAKATHSCALIFLAAGTPKTRATVLEELPALEDELSAVLDYEPASKVTLHS